MTLQLSKFVGNAGIRATTHVLICFISFYDARLFLTRVTVWLYILCLVIAIFEYVYK